MSKRLHETGIWEKPWFRKLEPGEKAAFIYILDKCDYVGLWQADFELAEFEIGQKIDWPSLIEKTNENIMVLECGKWFIKEFCKFQYGNIMKIKSSVRNAVEKRLKEYGLWNEENEEYEEEQENDNDIDDDIIEKDINNTVSLPLEHSSGTGKEKGEGERRRRKEKGERRKEKGGLTVVEQYKVDEVIKFYNNLTGRSLKLSTLSNRKNIKARLEDGFSVTDCLITLEYKFSKWWDDEKTRPWFNLVTLFRPSHFETYLAEAKENEIKMYEKAKKAHMEKQWNLPKEQRNTSFPDYEKWRKNKWTSITAQAENTSSIGVT